MVDDTCNRETEAKRDIGSEREEGGWEGKRMGGEGEEERGERDVHNDSESPQKRCCPGMRTLYSQKMRLWVFFNRYH